MGVLVRRAGQTAVIGEICAGILLGPSFLGRLLPDVERMLFPASSLEPLHLVSEVGVILFLFVVGMEVDVERLRLRARAAAVISAAGIVVPFALGVILAAYLQRDYATPDVPYLTFALFMGTAMSITAFPVLARILAERRLAATDVGNTAIACAAIDDVSAWCLLAFAVAIARGETYGGTIVRAVLGAAFAVFMLRVVRPNAGRIFGATSEHVAPAGVMTRVVLVMFAAAALTDAIGLHPLFGAFVAGVSAGAGGLREPVRRAIEPLTAVVLLPLFFAYSGLRTEIGLIHGWGGWIVCAVIALTATVGKLGGVAAAARLQGTRWREALALGVLMNTRGLMELIVLNVGYDLGILSPALYSMMVLMALATTCMAAPLLTLLRMPPP